MIFGGENKNKHDVWWWWLDWMGVANFVILKIKTIKKKNKRRRPQQNYLFFFFFFQMKRASAEELKRAAWVSFVDDICIAIVVRENWMIYKDTQCVERRRRIEMKGWNKQKKCRIVCWQDQQQVCGHFLHLFLQNGAAPTASLRIVGCVDFVLVAVKEKFTRSSFPSVVNFSDGHHSDLLSLHILITHTHFNDSFILLLFYNN